MLPLNISHRRFLLRYINPNNIDPQVLNEYEDALALRLELLIERRIYQDILRMAFPPSLVNELNNAVNEANRIYREIDASIIVFNHIIVRNPCQELTRFYIMRRNFALKQNYLRHFNFLRYFNRAYVNDVIGYIRAFINTFFALSVNLRFLKK